MSLIFNGMTAHFYYLLFCRGNGIRLIIPLKKPSYLYHEIKWTFLITNSHAIQNIANHYTDIITIEYYFYQ